MGWWPNRLTYPLNALKMFTVATDTIGRFSRYVYFVDEDDYPLANTFVFANNGTKLK